MLLSFAVTWGQSLSCVLLLAVLALLLFLSLCSAIEKTEFKVDKDLLCDGVKLSVK